MKTIVEIEWNEPQEQAWLCADNIAVALSAYCKNTIFKVVELSAAMATIERDTIKRCAKVCEEGLSIRPSTAWETGYSAAQRVYAAAIHNLIDE